MRLSTLSQPLTLHRTKAFKDVDIRGICADSKRVRPGDLFIARAGKRTHGIDHASEAVRRGAVAVVTDSALDVDLNVEVLRVADAGEVVALICDRFYEHPSRNLLTIGVTGTNGKTTVAYFLESVLNTCGQPAGIISTVCVRTGERRIPASRTTPEPSDLHSHLAEMVRAGRRAVVMEVSSHALMLGRVKMVDYDGAVYTNLSHDHLDFHGNLDAYLKAKLLLFRSLKPEAVAALNGDDPQSGSVLKACKGKTILFGSRNPSVVRASGVVQERHRTRFTLSWPEGQCSVSLKLLGRHNVSNALAAFTVAWGCGLPPVEIVRGLELVKRIPGRMEEIQVKLPFRIWVDYAHTPDALATVLSTLKNMVKGRRILVFGCGGDRDKDKRPVMGLVAGTHAESIILTSDNPRSEDSEGIIEDILKGMNREQRKRVVVEQDRSLAIRTALVQASSGDGVLIAGKGHETVQQKGDETFPFSDREVTVQWVSQLTRDGVACISNEG